MTRECGTCTECCYLNEVPPLGKGANERCEHQSLRGCAIYDKRPKCCAAFNCAWLLGIQPKYMKPDKTGAVVWATSLLGTNGEKVTCVQISVRAGKPLNAKVLAWAMRLSQTVLVQIFQGKTRALYQRGRKILTWNQRDFFNADIINGQLVNLRVIPGADVLATARQ